MSTLLTSFAKSIFLRSLERLRGGSLELIADGRTWEFGEPGAPLRATVVVHNDRFFHRALFGGDVALGEAWMDGDWSSPDLVAVVRLAVRNLARLEQQNRLLSALSRGFDALRHRLRGNSITGQPAQHPGALRPEQRLLPPLPGPQHDVLLRLLRSRGRLARSRAVPQAGHASAGSCAWGPRTTCWKSARGGAGLPSTRRRHYGCRVTTTTISRRQYEYARERFDVDRPSGERIELLQEDYRNLRGQYDKIVSIEMFEAVGLRYYDEFFRACDRLLRPDGSMLMQTITINEQSFPAYHRRQRLDSEVHLSRDRNWPR